MGVRHIPSDVALDDSWLLVCLNTQVSSGVNTCFIIFFSFFSFFLHIVSWVILTAHSEFQILSVQREKDFACNYPLEWWT